MIIHAFGAATMRQFLTDRIRPLTIRVRVKSYPRAEPVECPFPPRRTDVAGRLLAPSFRYGARPAPYRWSPKCGDRCSHSSALTVPGRSQRRTPPGMASAGHRNCTRYLNIGELRGSAPRCGGSDRGVRPRLRARNPSDQRRSWLRRVATLPSRPSSFCCLLARLARCGEVPPRRVGVQFSRFSGWVFQ
jgi:hypothetical protein